MMLKECRGNFFSRRQLGTSGRMVPVEGWEKERDRRCVSSETDTQCPQERGDRRCKVDVATEREKAVRSC